MLKTHKTDYTLNPVYSTVDIRYLNTIAQGQVPQLPLNNINSLDRVVPSSNLSQSFVFLFADLFTYKSIALNGH